MKIKRHAFKPDRGETPILNDEQPTITVTRSGLRLQCSPVVESRNTSAGTTSTYTVEVSKDDLLRMIKELFDESVAAEDDI